MLSDVDFMDRALFLAACGRGRTSPNPMVGAVVVSSDGLVVGQGFHERAGEAHAEVRALELAGVQAAGATLYCTLEPCCHVGRTGPCVQRIVDAGIRQVVAAMEDPNPAVRGRGFAFLTSHDVDVRVGLGGAAASRLNQPFLTMMRARRPFVVLKAATSVDGCIAAIISDMGFDWRLGKGFFTVSRTPGLIAHAYEQMYSEKPYKAAPWSEIVYMVYALLGAVADIKIANIVDPEVTVRVAVPKYVFHQAKRK